MQEQPTPSGVAGQAQDRPLARQGPSRHRVDVSVARLAIGLGRQLREERLRRRLTLQEVADMSGLGRSTVHDVESGRLGSLETYVRLSEALRLQAEFALVDPRRRQPPERRAADPVHAAMGEAEAVHFRPFGLHVSLDEPFQHYQFAGRADVVVWSSERAALLHIENKTRFPDIQDGFGSFNAKRSYLGRDFGARVGIDGWRSETHVIAALWSSEILRTVRSHGASFGSVCPDRVDSFEAWWRGDPPTAGRNSVLVFFDPIAGRRCDRRRWAGIDELSGLRLRYRGYADAVVSIAGHS